MVAFHLRIKEDNVVKFSIGLSKTVSLLIAYTSGISTLITILHLLIVSPYVLFYTYPGAGSNLPVW